MGMIVVNILTDVLYDLLTQDKPHFRPRNKCDLSHLYHENRKIKKNTPTNGWGGEWEDIEDNNIATGDDVERMRLTRNELQHSREFKLEDTRFNELCTMLSGILKRFDQLIKPARNYTDHLNEILSKNVFAEEVQLTENERKGKYG